MEELGLNELSNKEIDESAEGVKEVLQEFNTNMQERINEVKNSVGELCLIKDDKRGIVVELHSSTFNAEQLTNLSLQAYDILLNKQKSGVPLGVS